MARSYEMAVQVNSSKSSRGLELVVRTDTTSGIVGSAGEHESEARIFGHCLNKSEHWAAIAVGL